MQDIKKAYLDYETFSEVDLKKVGAYKYASHPSTGIICFSLLLDGWKKPVRWRSNMRLPGPKVKMQLPEEARRIFLNPKIRIVAHNAFFEQVIYNLVLLKYFPELPNLGPERFECSSVKCASHNLPRDLEKAALALKLPVKKNMNGRRLVLKYCKPTQAFKKWKANPNREAWGKPTKYHHDKVELNEIYDYCDVDVIVSRLIDKALPDPIPMERELWILNQKANLKGVLIDFEAVQKILKLVKEFTNELEEEFRTLVGGRIESVNQRDAVLKFLRKKEKLLIPNLQAKTIQDILASDKGLTPTAKRILQIRQEVSRASIKKYYAMVERMDLDHRVRDNTLYNGASTGRDTGRGLQVHNFPRGKVKNTDFAIQMIKENDLETLKILYHSPMELFSSCLRGMILPTPGCKLMVSDLNAIECRILNWICDNEEVVNDFRLGRDAYKKMASRVLGIKVSEVDGGKEDGPQRFFGKTTELASGYGMGGIKHYKTCVDWGVPNPSLELSKKAVKVYRETHKLVVAGWANTEEAAIRAVENPGKRYTVCKVTWVFKDKFLWAILPSGRRLAFYGPEIKKKKTPWGEMKKCLYHWSVDSMTKRWVFRGTYGGKLIENICQGIAADVMKHGLHGATKLGYENLFSVHDEIISEAEQYSQDEYDAALSKIPTWAKGLPIKAKGFTADRYRKG
jgi:DNA polymerase